MSRSRLRRGEAKERRPSWPLARPGPEACYGTRWLRGVLEIRNSTNCRNVAECNADAGGQARGWLGVLVPVPWGACHSRTRAACDTAGRADRRPPWTVQAVSICVHTVHTAVSISPVHSCINLGEEGGRTQSAATLGWTPSAPVRAGPFLLHSARLPRSITPSVSRWSTTAFQASRAVSTAYRAISLGLARQRR